MKVLSFIAILLIFRYWKLDESMHVTKIGTASLAAALLHMYWNNISTFQCVAIAAAAGGSNAQTQSRPQRKAPTGQATERGGHSHSQCCDAASESIDTAASAIPVTAALCSQAITNIVEVVCGYIGSKSLAANRVNPFHVPRRCPNSLCNCSKGNCTKTGDSRNQMDSRCLDQLDDAQGSDYGIFTDFQEMFWETIRGAV